MKTFLIITGAIVTGGLVLFFLRKKSGPQVMLTPQQKMAGSNATLDAYQDIIPPIAQLSRVPWTQTNLRTVDPVIEAPIGYPAIPQNGGW